MKATLGRPAAWSFPAMILFSLAVHGAVLMLARVPSSAPTVALEHPAEMVAVTLVEPAPPDPVPPEPEPEPTPPPPPVDPEPPTPPEPEPVLTVEEAPPPPRPVATPKPEPPPRPRPVATPQEKIPTKPAPRPPASRTIVQARPDYASNPPPRYPEMARRKGWEGEVVVRARVNAAGRVTSVSLHKGSRYGVLDQAALAAVKGWRFRPGTAGGEAVESVVEVPVTFSLRR